MIAGISRVRNESLILKDTLEHFSKHCDHIFIYDDCSTDDSVKIMQQFKNVTIIKGKEWSQNQWQEETKHRGLLLDIVKKSKKYEMCLCFDADERLMGKLPKTTGGYSVDLFDGYLTKDLNKPYKSGRLSQLSRMWGPECREILVFFDPTKAKYDKAGQREPSYSGKIKKTHVKIKHFGKCLSVEHWEETCDFYSRYFPQWAEKWERRKGKAIHIKSDFGAELYNWNDLLCLKY